VGLAQLAGLASFSEDRLAPGRAVAAGRGVSLAQLALQWVLRKPVITSALIGASSVKQIEENLAALGGAELSSDELAAIDAACAL
jgi:L-glyceraldehyde 3-phosphate reductase